MRYYIVALLLAGCYSSQDNTNVVDASVDSSDASAKAPAPTNCLPPVGVYHITYSRLSGNCGDVPDSSVSLPLPDTLTGNCQILSANKTSCSSLMQYQCVSTETVETDTISLTSNDDGSILNGTVNVHLTGSVVCDGVYSVKEVRGN